MAITGFFHHIGTFLLLVATVLLVITSISAPVVNHIGLLKVNLGNATSEHDTHVYFGTFGWCVTDTANDNHDYCSSHRIGYSPANVMTSIEDTTFSEAYRDSASGLTRVMILHPIACGISFIAFLLGAGAGFFGSFLAALVSLIAFIVTVVALICDFVLFAIVRDHVNSNNDDTSGSHASYSVAIWTILVAAICSLIGAVILFFTCCSARLHKRRNAPVAKNDYGTATTTRRRRWF